MTMLLDYLKTEGFKKHVYTKQDGKPVFYRKVFKLSDVPKFYTMVINHSYDEWPPNAEVVLEIDKDGNILQYCLDLGFMDTIDTSDTRVVNGVLNLFGL